MAKKATAVAVAIGIVIAMGACSSNPATGPSGATADAGDSGPGEVDGGRTPVVSDKVNVTIETLDVEGTLREYALAVPKQLEEARTYPLVLSFHGDGGTGPSFREGYTFDAATADEAIVAYPTGINSEWDIYTPSASNPDMKFVDALVKELKAKHPIDSARVFGTGYSSGAFLINKIACRRTGFFRGIVSHAGGAPDESQDPDATQWPSGYTKCAGQSGGVAAMVVHGANDDTVGVDGGEFSATYWAALNGCQETRSATTPAPCQKYDGCPTNQPVLWCLISGLTHVVWDQGAKEGWAFMKSL